MAPGRQRMNCDEVGRLLDAYLDGELDFVPLQTELENRELSVN